MALFCKLHHKECCSCKEESKTDLSPLSSKEKDEYVFAFS